MERWVLNNYLAEIDGNTAIFSMLIRTMFILLNESK